MKIELPSIKLESVLDKLFPVYGTKGWDVPSFDRSKHMYLVDQYQYESGNRTLTYVALSDAVIVELMLGHFHSHEYMNRLRILTPDGKDLKVIATRDWGQKLHTDMALVRSTVAEELDGYISSSPLAKGVNRDEIRSAAGKISEDIFSKTEDYLDTPFGRGVLRAYCAINNVCRDFMNY